MSRFRKLDPGDVHIGKGATAAAERAQFVEAIKDAQAGRIELEPGDSPSTVKRRLADAQVLQLAHGPQRYRPATSASR
jgi:hypothetical protein